MRFVELELVLFLKFASYYPIDNIVLVNTKSKNGHKKYLHDMQYMLFLSPRHQRISILIYFHLPPATQQHNHGQIYNPPCHYPPSPPIPLATD